MTVGLTVEAVYRPEPPVLVEYPLKMLWAEVAQEIPCWGGPSPAGWRRPA